ncbi:MAG: peptidylprolyl isomerase [Rhodospirillaceae bacterium]|nr:peptidylprolyl isomerase [Rhodospirillaceae bacterium]
MTFSISVRTAAVVLSLCILWVGAAMAQDTKPADNPVVATVNGEKVLLSDLQTLYVDLPERVRRIPFEQIYRPLLEQVIQIKLSSAQARKNGLHKSSFIQRRLQSFADRILQETYLKNHVDRMVTEDQLKEAYHEYLKKFRGDEEVKARHILLKTKKESMTVIDALEKGAEFANLAREKSIGPSKTNGGDLGWFDKKQMVKPFADAAFALKKGEFSKMPVKTQFGWHVILLEDRRRKAPPKYAAMKSRLKDQLGSKLAEQEIERLRAEARIVRFGPDGEPLDVGKPKKKEQK